MRHSLAAGLVGAVIAAAAVPALAQDKIAERDMLRYCQGEASAEFDVNPRYISMGELRKNDNGAHTAAGTYEGRNGDVAFKCRFDPNGRFKWVRSDADTAAHSGEPSRRQVSACNDLMLGTGKILEVTPLVPGAYELIMAFPDGNFVCDVEADGKVTYFEKLR
jgi:hypothetical protein